MFYVLRICQLFCFYSLPVSVRLFPKNFRRDEDSRLIKYS